MNNQLEIYQNREMAAEYFLTKKYCIGRAKEAYRYPKLIITNDNRLGWSIFYEIIEQKIIKKKNSDNKECDEKPERVKKGIIRVSFSKGSDVIVKPNSSSNIWFRKIEPNNYFIYQGDIWFYKTNKVPGRHWILKQNVIKTASILEQLQITDSSYLPYMSIDKKTKKVINCYWIAEKDNKMQDMQAVFRNFDTNFNPVSHKLVNMAYWDKFTIANENWHLIEHKGQFCFSPCK